MVRVKADVTLRVMLIDEHRHGKGCVSVAIVKAMLIRISVCGRINVPEKKKATFGMLHTTSRTQLDPFNSRIGVYAGYM